MKIISMIVSTSIIGILHAMIKNDEIIKLPGYNSSLPSKQYSGYLKASDTSNLHYWLVESESNPLTDPVVIWFNGGPGCSSLDGFFYEHGPFEINSSKDPTLTLREYRWSRIVNMLYIEAPVGVGFSYSSTSNYNCADDRTANENRAAVEYFYSQYPEYKNNKLFITGESYAGIYVPTLAEAIVKGEQDGTYTGARLTGIAVGNGCTGTEVGICGSGPQGTYYEWSYLLQTAFIDSDLKAKINTACDWAAAAKNTVGALSLQCVGLLNSASQEISNVDLYNIYGDCVNDSGCSTSAATHKPRGKVPVRNEIIVEEAGNVKRLLGGRIIPHGPDACIDSGAASAYLNQDSVMAAIHVKNPGYCWSVCGTAPTWDYNSTRTNLPLNTYPLLVSNINVVIFNGDWDACVPYTDNEAWTEGMGYTAKKSWHSWSYTSAEGNANQVGGYAVNYDVSALGNGSFEFVTVRGGRHEVPESAPAQAFELLTRLIQGKEF